MSGQGNAAPGPNGVMHTRNTIAPSTPALYNQPESKIKGPGGGM